MERSDGRCVSGATAAAILSERDPRNQAAARCYVFHSLCPHKRTVIKPILWSVSAGYMSKEPLTYLWEHARELLDDNYLASFAA